MFSVLAVKVAVRTIEEIWSLEVTGDTLGGMLSAETGPSRWGYLTCLSVVRFGGKRLQSAAACVRSEAHTVGC